MRKYVVSEKQMYSGKKTTLFPDLKQQVRHRVALDVAS